MLTPTGPGQSPALLPSPKRRWLGRRLNRVPAAIAVTVGLILSGAIAYTLHEAHQREERNRELTEAAPASADAGSVTKDMPNGYIQQATFRPPHIDLAKPVNVGVPPKPRGEEKSDDNGLEDERKRAWKRHWDEYDKVQQQRFDKRQEALFAKTSVTAPASGGASGGANTAAAAAPAQQLTAATAPQTGLGNYAGWSGMGGLPGLGLFGPGLGPAPQIDAAAQQQKVQFAGQTGDLGQNDLVPTIHQPPIPNAVMAGSYIKMVSENEINSDVPGSALGRVTEAVYNTSNGQCVMIPAGSKIIGHYNSQISAGQSRLPGVMTRIIFPDGSSQAIGAMEAADNAGSAGWDDQVDRHLIQKFGSAFVAGLFGAAIQLSVPHNSYGNGYDAQQIIGASLGQQMGQLGQQIAQQNLSIPNTLTIRAGYPYTIILDKDLIMRPWSCDGQHGHQSLLPIMTSDDQ
jgi:type IV secretory pathway VirB10-like protein